jgi:DNA replication protein DnaC
LRDAEVTTSSYPSAVERWFAADAPFDAYICGGTGTGKSWLAAVMLKHSITSWGTSGAFITADRFIEACYDEVRNNGELPDEYSDPHMLKYLRRGYDLVVLDGLGEEKTTEFTIKAVTSLIIARYDQMLPTIITASRPLPMLSSIYGDKLPRIIQDSISSSIVLKERYVAGE